MVELEMYNNRQNVFTSFVVTRYVSFYNSLNVVVFLFLLITSVAPFRSINVTMGVLVFACSKLCLRVIT